MRRLLTYLFMSFALVMNVYLLFCWQPEGKNNNIIQGYEKSTEVMSYSKSIYTENKDNIMKNLSDEDKKDLNRIISNLSTVDIGRIQDYFKTLDDNRGLVEIFKVFSKRLSSTDYMRIRKICSNFVDIQYLDSELKKEI
ncbi:hypothetical protein [Clostridium uliginosum]|uniref:Uncharacterized protein n=1 Tax=Clostridium uliginosum TaxID=119641 RepID=A0A1I1I8Z2_9CLOT|nr:hypothetical protein [Clostridium uliginosum]SFC32656.1 hypothetical protein SAMN05421842_102187 [Clostridium uliginosum]